MRLRVPHTIESGFDHSLHVSQILIPSALFFASIAGVCLQLHIDSLLRDIKGLGGELSHREHIWPRAWGISELKRLIQYLTAFHSQSEAQLSNSPVCC